MSTPEQQARHEAMRAAVMRIVAEVVAEMRRTKGSAASAAPNPAAAAVAPLARGTVIVLLCGSPPVPAPLPDTLRRLQAQGYALQLVQSHTFEQAHPGAAAHLREQLRLPAEAELRTEAELKAAAKAAVAILTPVLSKNAAAKFRAGTGDSRPSFLLQEAASHGRPIFVAGELPNFAALYPAAPPAWVRTQQENYLGLAALGVRFCGSIDGAAQQLRATFEIAANEVPARLAKSTPSPKRRFITADDVIACAQRGEKTLRVEPGELTTITDAGREAAATRGIEIA